MEVAAAAWSSTPLIGCALRRVHAAVGLNSFHFLGHAGVRISSQGQSLVIDPWFGHPFSGGNLVPCPPIPQLPATALAKIRSIHRLDSLRAQLPPEGARKLKPTGPGQPRKEGFVAAGLKHRNDTGPIAAHVRDVVVQHQQRFAVTELSVAGPHDHGRPLLRVPVSRARPGPCGAISLAYGSVAAAQRCSGSCALSPACGLCRAASNACRKNRSAVSRESWATLRLAKKRTRPPRPRRAFSS
jgi:hypothetical protein